MRGIQKVLQVDMLDWKTFKKLYTKKRIFLPNTYEVKTDVMSL